MRSTTARLIERFSGHPVFMRIGPRFAPQLDRIAYRLTGGRVIPSSRYRPSLFLTATGRRSGQPRTVPLLYMPDGDRFIVIASNYGRQSHPAWSYNIKANPRATVELAGRRVIDVVAHLAEGEERAALWERIVAYAPNYRTYDARTEREIQVFVLEPVGTPG